MAATLGADNPFRYKGYYYDSETGFYYLNSRYYNPNWGRFINADSVLGQTGGLLSHNLFAYCANNPVMASDPSGHVPEFIFPLIGELLANAGSIISCFGEFDKIDKVRLCLCINTINVGVKGPDAVITDEDIYYVEGHKPTEQEKKKCQLYTRVYIIFHCLPKSTGIKILKVKLISS